MIQLTQKIYNNNDESFIKYNQSSAVYHTIGLDIMKPVTSMIYTCLSNS